MRGYAYLNGEIVTTAEARVSVLDRGFLWGDGVYEITPCFDGKLFRLEQHLERLHASLRFVGIALDMSSDDLLETTRHIVDLNKEVTSSDPVCRVGHWITRGIEEWVPLDARSGGPTLCILVQPVPRALSPQEYRAGVALSIVTTRRSPRLGSRPESEGDESPEPDHGRDGGRRPRDLGPHAGHRWSHRRGPDLQLLLGPGRGTPHSESGERFAGDHAAGGAGDRCRARISAREADLSPSEIATATEFFITASTWGVLPVSSIDRSQPAGEVPGEITTMLIDGLAELTGHHPLEPHVRRESGHSG